MKTSKTVPGQIVMRVLRTKRVLKLMRLSAPILRLDASVKSLLCKSMERHMRQRRKNMGNERMRSIGTSARLSSFVFAILVVQIKLKLPAIGCTKQTSTSTVICVMRCHVIAMRQSSIQLSMIKSLKYKNIITYLIIQSIITMSVNSC